MTKLKLQFDRKRLRHWLVQGKLCWGKGKTRAESLRKCQANYGTKKMRTYLVYRTGSFAEMTDAGQIRYKAKDGYAMVESVCLKSNPHRIEPFVVDPITS